MTIYDLDTTGESAKETADEYLSKGRKDYIKKSFANIVNDIINDEYDYLEESAEDYINDTASKRAVKFLEAVISGNVDKFKKLIKCDNQTSGRCKEPGIDAENPWAEVIYGNIFLTDNVKLRRDLCKQFKDVIQNERIKDLESIVDGLVIQIAEQSKRLKNRY